MTVCNPSARVASMAQSPASRAAASISADVASGRTRPILRASVPAVMSGDCPTQPTAHVDAASEDALVAAIARAARGRTVLIATHSPRLAAIADRIVRLEAE